MYSMRNTNDLYHDLRALHDILSQADGMPTKLGVMIRFLANEEAHELVRQPEHGVFEKS